VKLKGDWGQISAGGGYFFSRALTEEELLAGFEKISVLPPSRSRDKVLGQLIELLAEEHPLQARAFLESWDDGLIEIWTKCAKEVSQGLAGVDLGIAVDFIEESVPQNAQAEVWHGLFHVLQNEDRIRFLEKFPDSSLRSRAAGRILHGMVAEDAEATAAWFDEYSQGRSEEELSELERRVYRGGNRQGSADDYMTAFRHSETETARGFLAKLVWRKADEEMKDEVYEELLPSRPSLIDSAWYQAVYSDPGGTARSLDSAQVVDLDRWVARFLFEQWARKDVTEAIEWGIEHQRPEVAVVLGSIAEVDPSEVRAAAEKMPQGKDLDGELKHIVSMALINERPERAKELIPLISDQKVRQQLMSKLNEGKK
jgi:hypothetical protein